MKLTSTQIEQTLGQFEAKLIPENHPVVPQLRPIGLVSIVQVDRREQSVARRKKAESRYVICRAGEGYSVEDRKTGRRVSYHLTWTAAADAAEELRRWKISRLLRPHRRRRDDNGF